MHKMILTAAPRLRRLIRWFAIFTASLTLLWALAWLAVPPLLKSQAEQRLSALLGREVSIGRVGFAPWALALTVEQFRIGAVAGASDQTPQFSVERIHVNADLRSLLRLAPVIEAIEVSGPKLRIARLADDQFDIDDVLARLKRDAPPEPDDKPARFAIYNLQLTNGALEFDDRPVQRRHRVQGLQLALPFLSNLPGDVAVTVEPRLAFTLDGAKFDSGAHATPFAKDHASQLELRIADLNLAPWLPYLPAKLPVRPSRGVLAGTLQMQFSLPADGTPRVSIKGVATLRDAALVTSGGEPLATWRQLQVGLVDVQPLARRVALGTVTLEGAQLELRRNGDGQLNLLPAGSTAPPTRAPATPAAASASGPPHKTAAAGDQGWHISVEQLTLSDARTDWHDASTQPAAALRADALELSVQKLRWPFEAPAPLTLSGRLASISSNNPTAGENADAAAFTVQGVASDRQVKASFDLKSLDLRMLAPYVAQALTPRIDGQVSFGATLEWAEDEQPRLALSNVSASAQSLRLTESGDPPRNAKAAARNSAASMASMAIADSSVDLLARRIVLGSVKVERPMLRVSRDREGAWNMLGWAHPVTTGGNGEKTATAAPWAVELGDAQLSNGTVHLDDRRPAATPGEPVRVLASGINVGVRGFTWPGSALARTQLQFGVRADPPAGAAAATPANPSGHIYWTGQFGAAPLQARGTLRIDRLPVHAFEPYFGSELNLALLRAEATWRGDFAIAQRASGLEARARGDAMIGDLRVHERDTATAQTRASQGGELLSWQSLALRDLHFAMKPGSKPRLEIADAALTDLYSRLVITDQGRFNLRDVAAPPGTSTPTPTPDASAPASAAMAASAPPAAPAAPGSGLPIDITIGGAQLVNGKVDFTDRFVRPNYSAALTELNGRLGAFKSDSRDMATLDLRGRAAGTALLEISGALNPTVQPLALDIRAKATDLELAALSPYAGRYAGYAIERGKLSMDVAYKIDPDGKLDAKNQVILNQLTFGDKVESPDATKLPVLLAVALLKDRNGVIDINLPVSGSINDPQFSVFGIVLKIIGNLLVKALTAPFALLAGGGSEDLSVVSFEPGTAALTDSGRAALDKVAKALTDRPALKMTVTGSSDPVSERSATQRAALESRIHAEQRRDALRAGAEASAPLPPLPAAQRESLVRRVYADTKLPNKPRNVLGLVKDIPVTEMQALLLGATPVTPETARELALQRGLVVRDALVAKGLPSERLFLAAPKLRAAGEDATAWTPRAQLALGVN